MIGDKTKDKKSILAERAVFRANSGFLFIDACLEHFHRGGTDAAYSRSLYVLFSYNFELMLKSRILLASSLNSREELLEDIKSHDLKLLSKKLSSEALKKIDIMSIEKIKESGFVKYVVNLIDGRQIILQDFTDVRYDFGKDALRNVDQEESKKMKNDIETLLKITKKIMEMVQ
ncbi:MAG: hypothetical protein HYT93_03905 [Parcubacteria group bacterium]|nr:hypothetical protein [Parcubacteria group bacterium]